MPLMKAAQIKQSIEQLVMLAPALMQAGEIVATAEAAEKRLVELGKLKEKLESELEPIQAQTAEYERSREAAREKFVAQQKELDATKANVTDELAKLHKESDAVSGQIKKLREERAEETAEGKHRVNREIEKYRDEKLTTLANLDDQIRTAKTELEAQQKALAKFRSSLMGVSG